MCSVTTAGNLHRTGNAVSATGLPNHLDICAPILLIEINGKEVAGFIIQKWIDAQYASSAEVCCDSFGIIRSVVCPFAVSALSLWLQADSWLPLIQADQAVSGTSILAFPTAGIHIRTTTEKGHEE